MKLESFFKLPAYDFGLETNRRPCQAFIFVSGKLSIQSVLGKQKKCAGT
jgi:hypothetical protein